MLINDLQIFSQFLLNRNNNLCIRLLTLFNRTKLSFALLFQHQIAWMMRNHVKNTHIFVEVKENGMKNKIWNSYFSSIIFNKSSILSKKESKFPFNIGFAKYLRFFPIIYAHGHHPNAEVISKKWFKSTKLP